MSVVEFDWSKVQVRQVNGSPRPKRKPFVAQWVKFPHYWSERLERACRLATYKLAHRILREAFKRQHVGGEVILSTAVTGLPRETRRQAIQELVALGLIRTAQQGNGAVIVTEILQGEVGQ
jgi:hypothetical protein